MKRSSGKCVIGAMLVVFSGAATAQIWQGKNPQQSQLQQQINTINAQRWQEEFDRQIRESNQQLQEQNERSLREMQKTTRQLQQMKR